MRRLALGLCCLLGCGQEQIVGYECPSGGCVDVPLVQPPRGECRLPIRIDAHTLVSELEVCWLASLGSLGPSDQPIYLTWVELEDPSSLYHHHVDVRLIESDLLPPDEYPDGEDVCGAAWRERASEPLLATEETATTWDFTDAPLVTDPSHRVMLNVHYINRPNPDPARPLGPQSVSLDITLHCTREAPPAVTQAFTFVRRELVERQVNVGEQATLCSSCNFTEEVFLRRLFRRTHQIDGFEVTLDGAPLWVPGDPEAPCRSDPRNPWHCELDEPLRIGTSQAVEWACLYRNEATDGDAPIVVASGTDACSLLGHYSRVGGGVEEAGDVQPCERPGRDLCADSPAF